MKEGQYPQKPYPTGNRNGKMNPLYSAWEVSDEVDDLCDENEFYQEGTFVSKQKCESLDERNIVVSCHLLAQTASVVEELGQVAEEHKGGDLPEKILLPIRSSNKALKEHKNKQLDISSTQNFLKPDLSACKQCSGPNIHPTSHANSRVKSLIPLAQRVFSAACAEPRKEMAFGKNQEISKQAHHLVSAGSMLWPHKTPGLKTRACGKLLDLCPKSAATRGKQRARSHSGYVSVDEAGPVSLRSASLVLGREGVQARNICASWQKEFETTYHRFRDCGSGSGGYSLRLCHADYRQPIYSGVTQGRILPSTHLYLWETVSRGSSQQARSQFRPFMWKSEGDERGATGPSGHPADSQPDSQAARPKDIRWQSMRQQNPEPPQTEQWQDQDFTLKHILQVLQCR
ncbi:uncharacterized protein LOC118225016 [Anguilla anguilla]|uniref:uncharacterized protein LOC118225016 n=1 Tax=Anguilla anguilla TaxID=7936 RepID=UPI0015AF7D4A|nr:uncharacterized protein LOC118225016 [Anguilla anguilla]XP_035268853.1 uncharacterized protein LOC118225016 [Anguilla anguilla]